MTLSSVTWASWGNFTNSGLYKSDPSTQTFNTLTVTGATAGPPATLGGYIQAVPGDVYKIQGDFINHSTQNTLWNTNAAELDFINGTTTAHTFALAGADLGQSLAGYTNNFAWGTLDLATDQTLTLSDGNATPGGALYVGTIEGETIVGDTVTDITGNGFDIYYEASLNPDLLDKTYQLEDGGVLAPVPAAPPVPEPATIIIWSVLGAGSWLGMRASRQRRGLGGRRPWSPEARQAILGIIDRRAPR